MSWQTSCAQFRAVGSLPMSGFVSEDTLGLEASCCVAFAIAKDKDPHTTGVGVTDQSVHYGYNREENKRRNLRIFFYQTI